MNPFISLCMIVKNEEKVLNRCLDSVKNYVDEIIIADTGSIDNTKKIALSFTPNVYDFEWNDDFSSARNYVQSKAKGKWILFLDADEYVEKENMTKIIQQLRNSSDANNYDAFVVTQINFVGTLAGNVSKSPTVRIYKNDPTIRFQRKIHEQLRKDDGELDVAHLGLNIYHSGYLKSTFREKNKNERNISLIQSEIERNPNSGYDHYNLANEYVAAGEFEEALTSYRKAFNFKDNIDQLWVPMAIERIVFCLLELKRYTEALDVIEDAVNHWQKAADFRSQRALIYFMQYRYEDAEKEIQNLIKDKSEYIIIQSLSYLEYIPYFILGRISEFKNDLTNAVYNYSQALNYNDKDFDTLKRLYPILIKNESRESVIEFIDSKNSLKSDVVKAYIFKILLDIGEVELVDNFLNIWKISPTDGFRIKLNIGKGKYNFARSIINKKDISSLLDEGWLDVYDILLLALELNKIDLFYELLKYNNVDNFDCLGILFKVEPLLDIENLKSHIIILLERCIMLNKYKLIDRIIQIVNELNIYSEIGDLFFKYGFEDIAFDFYGHLKDYGQLNEQSFVNIIMAFQKNNNEDEALHWAFNALEQNHHDFRIYKAALQLLEKRKAYGDLQKVLKMAQDVFPDSIYLKEFTNTYVSK